MLVVIRYAGVLAEEQDIGQYRFYAILFYFFRRLSVVWSQRLTGTSRRMMTLLIIILLWLMASAILDINAFSLCSLYNYVFLYANSD